MDVERQTNSNKKRITYDEIKNHVKEKANNPTASGTLILFLIVNAIMFLVGIIKMNECPVKKLIPVYLVVAGTIGILSKVLPFINRKLELKLITVSLSFFYVFEFIWMVVGSYWVYSIYKPNFDESFPLYCSKTAYYLSFWLLTINWVLVALAIILFCCSIGLAACCIAVDE